MELSEFTLTSWVADGGGVDESWEGNEEADEPNYEDSELCCVEGEAGWAGSYNTEVPES